MVDNLELIKRIKKIEDRIKTYEPFLECIQDLSSISGDIDKLYIELQHIQKSRDIIKENLTELSESQNKVYDEVVKVLSKRSKELEKEVNDCPIKNVIHDIETIKANIRDINKFIESFKTLLIK